MEAIKSDVLHPPDVMRRHLEQMGDILRLKQISKKDMFNLKEANIIGCNVNLIHEPGSEYYIALCQNGIFRTGVFQLITMTTTNNSQPCVETIAFKQGDSYREFLEATTRGLL